MGVVDRLSQPGVPTHIYTDRTVKRTDSTLDAAYLLWYDVPGSQYFVALKFVTQRQMNTHSWIILP
jgi:hypothetical protein